jgi:HK97 gp10 family phage protein
MVQGLAKFNRRWSAIPARVRKAARDTLEQNANEIVADMKRFVPVRDEAGGTLRDSINWTWGDAPEGSIAIGTVGGKEYSTLRITIYAGGGDAFYAVFQEFGTRNMPANPFFYPVWRARKRRVKSRLTRNINKAIKEA